MYTHDDYVIQVVIMNISSLILIKSKKKKKNHNVKDIRYETIANLFPIYS